MTTKTQTGSPITPVTAEDSQAPALRGTGGLQSVNAGGAPVYDDRTSHLDLPLPHADNELEDDVYRLRDAITKLDTALAGEQEARQNADASLSEAVAQETQAREEAVLTEIQTREQADTELESAVQEETQLRTEADAELAASLEAEATARAAGDAAEAAARAEHDASDSAHAALVRRITMGDLSPVIGVAFVESSAGGLLCNVDAEGNPIKVSPYYFEHHPTYAGQRRVLIDGQVMVEHPKFWFKSMTIPSGPLQGKHARIISPDQRDGFRPFPTFRAGGEAERDYWYCAAYAATDEGGNPKKLGSRPGKLPFVNVNFPTMMSYCTNRNVGGVSGFDGWDFYQVSEIILLMFIEFGTTNSQAAVGRGRVDTTAANYVDGEDVAQASWRGHCGLWGNVWTMVNGIDVTAAGSVRVWNNDGSRTWVDTGFILPAFDGTHMAYPASLKTGAGAGWDFDELFVPATSTLDLNASVIPDGFWGRAGSAGNVLYHGGGWSNGAGAGVACLDLNNPASYAYTSIGVRLAKV